MGEVYFNHETIVISCDNFSTMLFHLTTTPIAHCMYNAEL